MAVLVGVDRRDPASGEQLGRGIHQSGYICYTEERRVMVLISRRDPDKDQPTFISYAGSWEIEGSTVVHIVDMATRAPWVGTRQIRHFTFEGGRLILAPPVSHDFNHDITTQRALTWERLP
ncbi:lipocalin-like domain-containing protein [Roseiarcaceae bacterium H3SJ34-1]|uniref:lipocalin-like domain-containing protein n=1 Tax=Terripilifer ovatus TaxID=3032367 RepID=UPI003AB9578D|nr:lipocalin-like domain-containing protein [Roseiarcaceae bacterium H3SJ34-1]